MIRPRPHVAALRPVHHGSIADAELARLGLRRDQVIDFSTNTNPLGPSPAAVAAAATAAWTHYPDDGAPVLKRAIAEREGVDPAQVVVANGSAELIWLVALAFLGPGDRALVVGPTFGEYARATRVVGAEVEERRAGPQDDFTPPLDLILEAVDPAPRPPGPPPTSPSASHPPAPGPAPVLWLCDPNNPTGRAVGPDRLAALADAAPDTLVVVDEAYAPFVDDRPPWPRLPANVVRLRSLTKDGAMPGLRLGYAVAPPEVAAALDAVRPPWSVNAVAQAAGLAALADDAHLARARAALRQSRTYVTAELTRLGYHVVPSVANFLLVDVTRGARAAAENPGGAAAATPPSAVASRRVLPSAAPGSPRGLPLERSPASASSAMPTGRRGDCEPSTPAGNTRARLLPHRIVVRDCTSFGLPTHVRIGLRTFPDCQRLIAAFEAIA